MRSLTRCLFIMAPCLPLAAGVAIPAGAEPLRQRLRQAFRLNLRSGSSNQPSPLHVNSSPPRNALYRNLGNGRFEDVTTKAGPERLPFYGMGVAAADFDNDGCNFLEAACAPGHESMMPWVGGSFDAEAFDLAAVDRVGGIVKSGMARAVNWPSGSAGCSPCDRVVMTFGIVAST